MPAHDAAEVAAATRRLRLALDPRRRRHGVGQRLGSGPGAGLEFHDHRAYEPGDDLRHLDWGVYARTDQLVLRRHRVEVSPRVEVLLDASASMALPPAKFALAAQLAALIAALAEADGARAAVWTFAERARRLTPAAWRDELRALGAGGAAGFERRSPALATGAERVLISDGLCPGGGAAVVRALGAGAGRLCLIEILARAERGPAAIGPARLSDVEGPAADLVLDDAACAAYRARLARHQADWQRALAGRGLGVIGCTVEDGFAGALSALTRAGVVATRAG